MNREKSENFVQNYFAAILLLYFTVRGSTGISLNYGPPGYDLVTAFTRDDSKGCKTMLFSPDGRYFAWVNGYV